jgi:diguanylate cyclase (GGDEF)-like protein/PAS domain S-box-containing protein
MQYDTMLSRVLFCTTSDCRAPQSIATRVSDGFVIRSTTVEHPTKDHMSHPIEALLLIEDNPDDAQLIRRALTDTRFGAFQIEWVKNLSDGLERLSKGGIEAVLTDLSLPDSEGMETLDRLLLAAPHVPILVLSGAEDEDIASQTVQHGAQDYLPKNHLDSYTLSRAVRNMIDRKIAEDALFIETERAQVTLNSIGDAVLCTDSSGKITYLNTVAEKMTGWLREEASGRPLADVFQIFDGSTRQPAQNPMDMAVAQDKTVSLTANCILIRRDGYEMAIEDSAAPIHDREGHSTGAVIVFHDVSVARSLSLQMAHSAHHDFLTDLPNRMLLNDRLAQAIASACRYGRKLAVLYLDLDSFKHINDSLGHAVGDKLLQALGERLLGAVRKSDTVSRQGGDEFVVVVSSITRSEDAALIAEKIIAEVAASFPIGRHDLHVSISIGISVYPDDGVEAEALIQNADNAMYHSKKYGRNNYRFFKEDMNVQAVRRQSLEASLHRALERREFELNYQPMINLKSGQITGVEALLRWRHPERGLIPPAEFIPIAESSGLIVPIGRWVLREACRQARAWQGAALPRIRLAVNISTVEFRDKNFLANLRATLNETGLEPRFLELELTESVLMQHVESTAFLLGELSAMGVHLAVDDFGTGYSSLSYLSQFPISSLKIDKSFVQGITPKCDEAPIICAVINMGRGLKQQVVAEGVETREQLDYLQSRNCDEGQGYYFSYPVVANQFAKLLETGISTTILN